MQMLCTLPVLFIINKLLDMLNTLTKPRFQTFVKIFQGPTDRPTRLVLEAPPRSLKKCNIENGIVNLKNIMFLKQVDHEDAVLVAA